MSFTVFVKLGEIIDVCVLHSRSIDLSPVFSMTQHKWDTMVLHAVGGGKLNIGPGPEFRKKNLMSSFLTSMLGDSAKLGIYL